MSSGMSGSSQDLGDKLATQPMAPAAAPDRLTRWLAWSAVAGIIIAIVIMIAASAVRNSWEHVFIRMPADGPPWGLRVHVSLTLASAALWTAAVLGGAGVIAGLAALRRGGLLPARLLLGVGLVAVAAFTVLPPTGSTDALDYAAFGRMVVLGHTPYVMTPDELRRTGDPVGRATSRTWGTYVSIYGPLATGEQWAAAELGGTSAARIVFWLKLWNAIAFGAVVLALDRLLRSDPARRARAHLLWSANPLLLWGLIAAGHIDAMGAAAGFLGLIVLRKRGPADDPGALRWLAAGLLVGLAVDLKITYVLFGLGLAWAARRSVTAWLSAGAGALIVLLPSYLWFGTPAVKTLFSHGTVASIGNFYQTLIGSRQVVVPQPLLLGGLAFLAVAALMLWRLPDGVPALPAVQPALAIGVAWIFLWPYEFPWYDAVALCLLALYPASRLDWLVLIRLTASTFAFMPGNAGFPAQHVLNVVTTDTLYYVAPAILFACAVALVWMALTQRWEMGSPTVIPAAGRPLPA
jgi:hypothetical protein